MPALDISGCEAVTEAPAVLLFVARAHAAVRLAPGEVPALTRLEGPLSEMAGGCTLPSGWCSRRFVGPSGDEEGAKAAALERVGAKAARLDGLLRGRDRLLAGGRSAADAHAFVLARWVAEMTPPGLSGLPALSAFAGRMRTDPAVARALRAQGLAHQRNAGAAARPRGAPPPRLRSRRYQTGSPAEPTSSWESGGAASRRPLRRAGCARRAADPGARRRAASIPARPRPRRPRRPVPAARGGEANERA